MDLEINNYWKRYRQDSVWIDSKGLPFGIALKKFETRFKESGIRGKIKARIEHPGAAARRRAKLKKANYQRLKRKRAH